MPGQYNPGTSSATQARDRGASPSETSKSGFFTLSGQGECHPEYIHPKGQGMGPHKQKLFQTHKPPSRVSLGHSCQMCSYPTAFGLPSPVCSCPCRECCLPSITVPQHLRPLGAETWSRTMGSGPDDDSEGNKGRK